ncbi:MAG: AAA family ATPase, partial [Chitinophagaceae bacterium]|nr:AAA family ATPase [Chitinophagaceae bacterium]
MAIYHFHLSYTSRSGSGSAISHAAYMCATEGHDQRTNQTWNYSGKGEELLAAGISAKESTPDWCLDAEGLFNAAEKFEDYIAEKRFRGHKDPEKNAKSLAAKADYLQSCRTSYKVSFALPIEINSKEHLVELSKRVAKIFSDEGLPTLWAIHDKKGNPHLHLQCSIRPIVDGEFSEKKFTINKEKLVEIRKAFADVANAYAREKGYDYVVDHRSFKDRGIDMVPTKHLGPASYYRKEIFQNNHLTNEEIREENVQILLHKPEELIKIVAGRKSMFTRSDVYAELFKRVAGDERLFAAIHTKLEGMDLPGVIGHIANDNIHESFIVKENIEKIAESYVSKILESNNVISIGNNARGETFYTSKAHKESEDKATVLVDALLNSSAKTVSTDVQNQAIERAEKIQGFAFSEEQRGAIEHLFSDRSIAYLSGRAGTGKSTVLKPLVKAYQDQGFEVIGAAFQGKIADQLAADLGIKAYTINSMMHYWDKQKGFKHSIKSGSLRGSAKAQATRKLNWADARQLTSKSVVIVDEASMISGTLWNNLLEKVVAAGASIRIVGDNNQIKALHGLDIARLIEEKVGSYSLTNVVRQRSEWMREASVLLNDHKVQDGLKIYYDRQAFHFQESNSEAKSAIVRKYLSSALDNPQQSQVALAYTNADADELNTLIRSHFFKDKATSEQFIFRAKGLGITNPDGIQAVLEQKDALNPKYTREELEKSAAGKVFNLGERVMFLSNDSTEMFVQTVQKSSSSSLKGVKNGTLGTIENFDLKKNTLYVRLEDGRLVGFDTRKYDALTSAYALTVAKSQGLTVDKAYALCSKIDANNLLVMMTRHRDSFEGFVSKEIAPDFKGLVGLV